MHYKIFLKGLNRHITAKLNEKYCTTILALKSKKHFIPLSLGTAGYKMIGLTFSLDDGNHGLVDFELHKSVKSIDAIEIVIQMSEKLLDELK